MRSLLAVMFVVAVAVPLAVPASADAARFKSPKVKTGRDGGRGGDEVVKRGRTTRRGLSGIFQRRPPGQKSAARARLARTVAKVRKQVTFERVAIRAPIALMKVGTTMTFGAALTTGRPSVIVMAGVMTAAAYAMGPMMKLAERIGERIGERIVARADRAADSAAMR